MPVATRREPGELTGPRFAFFADVLVVGMMTALASLPLLTAPAAMSTGCAVLERRVRFEEPATAGRYATALRARLRLGDLLTGAAVLAFAGLLLLNAAVAGAGLPGAAAFRVLLWAVAAALVIVLLRACARPETVTNWPTALREGAQRTLHAPRGSAVLLLAVATAAVCAWAYPPLAALVPGPLALAARATDR